MYDYLLPFVEHKREHPGDDLLSAILAASDTPPETPRLYLPAGTKWYAAADWQAKGYAVVRGVTPCDDPRAEAKRLLCSHALIDGEAVPL